MPPLLEPSGLEPHPALGVVTRHAAVSHELNDVLTVISGSIALAERHAAGNPKLIRLLENMQRAADRGAGLARELMALSHSDRAENDMPTSLPDHSGQTADPRRILVVEDDKHVAEVATAVLEGMGHDVVLVADAPAALAALHADSAFDLVFSDIVMPGGMSGLELAEAIAASFPALPILLATGFSNAALAPGALRFPVLAKPYSVQELARRVAQLLTAKS
jgi:CheY-like chemotaxis protein